MFANDYHVEKKKKKKKDKEDKQPKARPVRNFQIIDDDVDINSLQPSEEAERQVDLLDPEGPTIAEDFTRVMHKVDVLTNNNKWVKLDMCEDAYGDLQLPTAPKGERQTSLFKKRGEKSSTKSSNDKCEDDNDSDLDMVPRKRVDDDGDLSPIRRKRKTSSDSDVDVNKVRVRKITQEEEQKKKKKEEKMAKYMEWGKGVVQKKEKEQKLAIDLHEAEKPLARYQDDKDLDRILKQAEREDDPMAAYFKKDKASEKAKSQYRGPPAPPNRYNIMPGPRWDGVDRSNGFEKKFYESIVAKKARETDAYKWSVEDM